MCFLYILFLQKFLLEKSNINLITILINTLIIFNHTHLMRYFYQVGGTSDDKKIQKLMKKTLVEKIIKVIVV